MKRPYRSAHFAELMAELDEKLDSPCLGTDVIVGFPSETEAAFKAVGRALRAAVRLESLGIPSTKGVV